MDTHTPRFPSTSFCVKKRLQNAGRYHPIRNLRKIREIQHGMVGSHSKLYMTATSPQSKGGALAKRVGPTCDCDSRGARSEAWIETTEQACLAFRWASNRPKLILSVRRRPLFCILGAQGFGFQIWSFVDFVYTPVSPSVARRTPFGRGGTKQNISLTSSW